MLTNETDMHAISYCIPFNTAVRQMNKTTIEKILQFAEIQCLKASREKLGGSFNFNSGGTRRVAEATSKSIKCEWGGCLFTVLVTDDASLIHPEGVLSES